MGHTCNLSTSVVEAGVLKLQDQSGQHREKTFQKINNLGSQIHISATMLACSHALGAVMDFYSSGNINQNKPFHRW